MKILVIGQAPPAQNQDVPYSTTMLYDWLAEIGISKDQAQNLFDWDAVYDKFPGFRGTSHRIPTEEEMDDYWERSLKDKVNNSTKIWIVGNVARKYLVEKREEMIGSKSLLFTMHPSKRNISSYRKVKDVMLERIKNFIYD